MPQTLHWLLSETNGSVFVTVSDTAGPVLGATVVARFRNPDVADAWLDHNDNAWKANASVTTLGLALTALEATDAPGDYGASLDFAATTGANKPTRKMDVIYVVTSPSGLPIDVDRVDFDVLEDTDAILADTADMQPKIGTPAADIAADIAAVLVDVRAAGTEGFMTGAFRDATDQVRAVAWAKRNGALTTLTGATIELFDDARASLAVAAAATIVGGVATWAFTQALSTDATAYTAEIVFTDATGSFTEEWGVPIAADA